MGRRRVPSPTAGVYLRSALIVAVTERVETVARVGDRLVHRFQAVRERRADGTTREWVVVDIEREAVQLATPDFEWTRSVRREAFAAEGFEPLTAGDVPVWGY